MNKTYCTAAFTHIYSDSAGNYKLCCHAYDDKNELKHFSSKDTAPFEFFLSDAMEDIRQRMIEGEEIGGCQKCYDIEREGFQSPRLFKYHSHIPKFQRFDVGDVTLKLRVFGNYCNLACYMCIPYNSSTRIKELKEANMFEEISKKDFDARIDVNQWKVMTEDILNHIDRVKHLHITGGEPLQLPKQYKFIESIPDDVAKNISLSFDTNFTELNYKGKNIFDYTERFFHTSFGISCDHFGDKLSWIRYPIDIKKFEDNLRFFKDNAPYNYKVRINVTTSILNVEDLFEIRDYYSDMGFEVDFTNTVNSPLYLNIKNHPNKEQLIKKYKNDKDMFYILRNLHRDRNEDEWKYALSYIKRLNAHRNSNFEELWPEYNV